MLVWSRSLQCIFDQKTSRLAAAFCNIHTVTYLHSIGCPFDPHAFAAAAERNDLDMMKFLKLNQCTWPYVTIGYHASYCGKVESMDWVQQPGCRKGEPIVAKWLRQQGAEWPSISLLSGDHSWRTCTLAWAVSEGYKYLQLQSDVVDSTCV
eukprot:10706-Heterococcus_DN1.PRE.1